MFSFQTKLVFLTVHVGLLTKYILKYCIDFFIPDEYSRKKVDLKIYISLWKVEHSCQTY